MKLLKSKRGIKLPIIYMINNRDELEDIPIGIPYIIGDEKEYDSIVKTIEFEVLLKSALATGLKFRWHRLLEEKGFENIFFESLAYSDGTSDNSGGTIVNRKTVAELVKEFGASYVVDIEVLKNLEILPHFYEDLEKALERNIQGGYEFNPSLFNKRLGIAVGETQVSNVKTNLIVMDVSGSIPVSIAQTNLSLAKTMCAQLNADLLITGRISTLFEYDDIDSMDINEIYRTHGRNNDQVYFKKIVSKDYRKYGTVIVFGDDHHPGQGWDGGVRITDDEGKKLCKWEVDKIISFHTHSDCDLAGYAKWFNCNDITYMENWVTYFE